MGNGYVIYSVDPCRQPCNVVSDLEFCGSLDQGYSLFLKKIDYYSYNSKKIYDIIMKEFGSIPNFVNKLKEDYEAINNILEDNGIDNCFYDKNSFMTEDTLLQIKEV